MSNQEMFETEARVIRKRNQATLDLKLYLCHWRGYDEVKTLHKKEIQALAQKHNVEMEFKKWKLNGHWM